MSDPTDTNDPATLRILRFADENRPDELHEAAPEFADESPIDVELEALSDGELEAIETTNDDGTLGDGSPIAGKRIALVGRFGSMNRREAANVLQSFQALVVDLPKCRASQDGVEIEGLSNADETVRPNVDWIVIGADQPPLSQGELLRADLIDAAAAGDLEIIQETELWERLGLIDVEQSVRRYYTPVMLADLLGISVRVIRRWHRRGLITPVTTLHKLPYFDYAEVATAKRLAGWIAAGASPGAIERRLVDLVHILPNIRRPLDQLSILIQGKHILLRQGDGLVEPGGQMRFDFDALDDPNSIHQGNADATGNSQSSDIVAFELPDQPPMLRASVTFDEDPILIAAYQAEDDDDLETAIDLYHTILSRDGARADVSFQIGELLYRMNFLVGARERYYCAIELDPEFVEARASLGAVLAELGQDELAIAALRGALSMYDDYADVHYTLAKTLDKVGNASEALEHWQRIIALAPDSPWAQEAMDRLGT